MSQLTPGGDHWTSLADLDVPRIAPAVGYDIGGLLIAGGKSGSTLLRSGVTYDPTSGVTGTLSQFSQGRQQFGGVQAGNGDLYLVGGKDRDGKVIGDVEFRSFVEGGWDDGAPKLPVAEFAMSAVGDGGSKIYILGGATADTPAGLSNRVFVFDIGLQEWQALAPLPTAVRDATAIYSPLGKIYVMGGVSAAGTSAAVQVYDVVANQWTSAGELPAAVSGASAVLDTSNAVHVIGGRGASGASLSTEFVSNDITQIDIGPLFNSSPELSAEPNVVYAYQAEASGSPAPTFSLLAGPAGMAIDETSGYLEWTPTPGQVGPNVVTIRAQNVAGAVEQSFTVNVHWTAPTIVSSPAAVADVGSLYSYRLSASGNPAPEYALVSGPSGMTIETATGQLQWTPSADQLGSQSVTLRATNLAGSADQSFTIDVSDRTAPTAPGGLTAEPVSLSSALLRWSPATDNVGVAGYKIYSVRRTGWRLSHTVYTLVGTTTDTNFTIGGLSTSSPPRYVVRAFDAAGNTSPNSASISPRPLIAPHLYYWSGVQTNGPLGIVANHRFALQLVVSGSPAPTLSIDAGPAGMTISPTGLVEWTPSASDVGVAEVTFRATNSVGTMTLATTIHVSPDLPVITWTVSGQSVVNQETTIALSDLSLTPSMFMILSGPDGVTLDDAHVLHFTPRPDQVGPSTVVVVATNSAGSRQAAIALHAYLAVGPTDLVASGLTGATPKLTWSAPPSAVPIAGYKVSASYSYQAGRFRKSHSVTIDVPGGATEAVLAGLKIGVNYSVRVAAYDAAGNTSLWSAPITVRYTPSLPKLTYEFNPGEPGAFQPLQAIAGQPLTIKLMDSNPLDRTYSIAAGPAGMVIDPVTGLVQWTPTLADVGTANIVLRATNEVGSNDVVLSLPVYFTGKAEATISDLTAAGTGLISVATSADNAFNLDRIVAFQVTIYFRSPSRWSWHLSRTVTVAPGETVPFVAPVRGAVAYRVSVRAIDADGNFGEVGASLQFRLPPA